VFILFYINLPNVLRQHPVFVTETVKHMISVPCRCWWPIDWYFYRNL